MPHISSLWSEVSKNRKDVVFLAVNLNDDKDVISKYWAEKKFAHDAVRQDESDVSSAFKVTAYPTNYVIGPDGNIIYRSVGWDEDAVAAALASTAN